MKEDKKPRSVLDYENAQELRRALRGEGVQQQVAAAPNAAHPSCLVSIADPDDDCSLPSCASDLDWYIKDANNSRPQTIEHEVERLMILKSYMTMGKEASEAREESLNRLTTLASRMFDTPAAFVSVLDLGKALFLARKNIPFDYVPRKDAICAHALLSKESFFEITDCSEDNRFEEFVVVQEPINVRYYAACPLISPEGYRLGLFGILDCKVRDPLNPGEIEDLKNFAQLAMDDIVRHRILQEQRQERESSSKVLASVAHDLLTPLTGVQLSLSLLNGDSSALLDRLTTQQKECLDTATSCAVRMGEICRTLRDTRTESPEVAPLDLEKELTKAEKVSSSFFVANLVDRLYHVTDALPKVVPLIISIDPALPASIVGEELAMFRIALDLLTFCCERATSGAVCLLLRLRESVGSIKEIVFEIEDTGPELEPETRDRVFECLFMCPTIIQELSGEGYDWERWGLDASSKHIRDLGGAYGVETLCDNRSGVEPGHVATATTRFWFSVPLGTVTAEVHKRDRTCLVGEGFTRRQKTALIVDDSSVVRKLVAKALAKLGYEAFQAENGLEGLEALKRLTYDLVLMDFLMPLMDGLDCVRTFREWEKDHRPIRQHIVGISAHASAQDVDRGYKLGLSDYRSKPITLETLQELDQRSNGRAVAAAANSPPTTPNGSPKPDTKRMRPLAQSNGCMCLIASDRESVSDLDSILRDAGWQVVAANDADSVVRFLQRRNWGIVLLDGAHLGGAVLSCVQLFRQWERQHRVLRQRNVFLMSAGMRRTPGSRIQLPMGFDGAIGKPIESDDICAILSASEVNSRNFNAHDIVTS